jgi:hypothetical protein
MLMSAFQQLLHLLATQMQELQSGTGRRRLLAMSVHKMMSWFSCRASNKGLLNSKVYKQRLHLLLLLLVMVMTAFF